MDPDKKDKLVKIIGVFIMVLCIVAVVFMGLTYFEREAMIEVIELEKIAEEKEFFGNLTAGLKP